MSKEIEVKIAQVIAKGLCGSSVCCSDIAKIDSSWGDGCNACLLSGGVYISIKELQEVTDALNIKFIK